MQTGKKLESLGRGSEVLFMRGRESGAPTGSLGAVYLLGRDYYNLCLYHSNCFQLLVHSFCFEVYFLSSCPWQCQVVFVSVGELLETVSFFSV
jgi:hypothetical protein